MAIINFIRDYERVARFKLGRFEGMKGPGIVWAVPILHQIRKVDTRTQQVDVPRSTSITRDNASIDIDFLVYMRIDMENAEKAVMEVQDYYFAVLGLATTTLRAVIGDIALDEVLSQRERINEAIRVRLDTETNRWGIKVTNVEIKEIEPPRDILEAMTRQMSAERTRRAVVMEAEGTREAAITVAEGEKQSAILRAEGGRQAEILEAEGDQQAAVLRADGFSTALERIFSVAKGVDVNTMNLQYLETLKALGASPSSKFIFPLEFTRLLGSLGRPSAASDEG
ncbi:MAG: SPFH/Band 7/PHB domain protein [Chloroflexi bacterium]|nr:SPFH/Band 7/PHB domain protein [Chloroflexota bacterium]